MTKLGRDVIVKESSYEKFGIRQTPEGDWPLKWQPYLFQGVEITAVSGTRIRIPNPVGGLPKWYDMEDFSFVPLKPVVEVIPTPEEIMEEVEEIEAETEEKLQERLKTEAKTKKEAVAEAKVEAKAKAQERKKELAVARAEKKAEAAENRARTR